MVAVMHHCNLESQRPQIGSNPCFRKAYARIAHYARCGSHSKPRQMINTPTSVTNQFPSIFSIRKLRGDCTTIKRRRRRRQLDARCLRRLRPALAGSSRRSSEGRSAAGRDAGRGLGGRVGRWNEAQACSPASSCFGVSAPSASCAITSAPSFALFRPCGSP